MVLLSIGKKERSIMRVLAIGEVLWDVFADREHFGGAALNFCANLQRMGDQPTLLSAVGDDARGRLALEKMAELSLDTTHVRVVSELPTGVAVIRMAVDGEPAYDIPRPAAFDLLDTSDTALDEARLSPHAAGSNFIDWLYFGSLLQTSRSIEHFTIRLAEQLHSTRCFYDINLRTGQWNLPLVQRLSALTTVLKLNEHEAETLFALTQPAGSTYSLQKFCHLWSETYNIETLCITLGAEGCAVYRNGELRSFSGTRVIVQDAVGAGDAFAAAFLHGYHLEWPLERSARFANAVGGIVASRAGATPPWSIDEITALMTIE
jgi:fructokinase